MDLMVNQIDIDDDDLGSYFLQPASSPYNIAEKIQQANVDLFNNSHTKPSKTSRVTFKAEVSTFEEPELTDDDVNSIESDPSEVQTSCSLQILEYKANLSMFNINEDAESEIVEEIEPDYENIENNFNSNRVNIENNAATPLIDGHTFRKASSSSSSSSPPPASSSKAVKPKRKRVRKKSPRLHQVDCKSECIEKLLDCDLAMSIRKLEIREKPANCPLLKLRQRQCCERQAKLGELLPCYDGHRSEYGLSSAELERREKRRELMKLKQQKRQQLLHEYRSRKIEQNEAVFCQWLNDLAHRKAVGRQKGGGDRTKAAAAAAAKHCISPNVVNFPAGKVAEKPRPHTVNEFVPRHSIKRAKRPLSSPCVFIQLPHKLLERGIHIGDLLVTNSNSSLKNLHVLAIS